MAGVDVCILDRGSASAADAATLPRTTPPSVSPSTSFPTHLQHPVALALLPRCPSPPAEHGELVGEEEPRPLFYFLFFHSRTGLLWDPAVRVLNISSFSFFFSVSEIADSRSNFGRPYLTHNLSKKYESFCSGFVFKLSIQ